MTGFLLTFHPRLEVWLPMSATALEPQLVYQTVREHNRSGRRLTACDFGDRYPIRNGRLHDFTQIDYPNGFVIPFDLLIEQLK